MGDISDTLGSNFIPSEHIGKRAFVSHDPPRIGARKAIEASGMKPPATFPIGEIFRFPDATDLSKGKSYGKGGWAIYYEFQNDDHYTGFCVFGSHHNDMEPVKWSNKNPDFMSSIERTQFNERIASAQQIIAVDREKRQADIAKECQKIWGGLADLSQNSYTKTKKIIPYGAKTNGNAAIISIVNNSGDIVSLQYISDNGEKKLHAGGKKKGCWSLINGERDEVYICEGWSTGCTIREATGKRVYVAIDCGNLYDVTAQVIKKETGRIFIAADDDYANEINAGIEAAKKAANAHNIQYIIPFFKDEKNRGTDFNDMAFLYGIPEVKSYIDDCIKIKKYAAPKIDDEPTPENPLISSSVFIPPKGILYDLAAFYNATSGNEQKGFATQTAITIASTMLGRYFITDQDNMASIYLLNVGKTATGKEHCKKVFERVLTDCGMENRIAGDGFTSGAAVHSLLGAKPCVGVVIDEFGRYLKAARDAKGSLQEEANTALMEAVSRLDGVLRPKNYSTMTLSADAAQQIQGKFVINPALTLLALTTPNTFFDYIKISSILDGFLNRFLVHISSSKRELRKRVCMFDTPSSIVDWSKNIKKIISQANTLETAQERPCHKRVHFSKPAIEIQQNFEIEMIQLQNDLEAERLEGVAGRSNEWSMRLALICALCRDPDTNLIADIDMLWSVNYIRHCTLSLLDNIRDNVYENNIEADKKEILSALRQRPEGITWAEMQMTNPFMKHKTMTLKEHLQSLIDADLIEANNYNKSGKRGRPSKATALYRACPD